GPGFRDFTRIAASDPKMWRDILLANRHELLAQAQIFQRTLNQMELLIESGDGEALEGLLAQASGARAQWRMGASKK
ncbi:MAG TPA: prephenate dehydrogenase dimerization domain-containing protein, partial [Ramlibacter sp.]